MDGYFPEYTLEVEPLDEDDLDEIIETSMPVYESLLANEMVNYIAFAKEGHFWILDGIQSKIDILSKRLADVYLSRAFVALSVEANYFGCLALELNPDLEVTREIILSDFREIYPTLQNSDAETIPVSKRIIKSYSLDDKNYEVGKEFLESLKSEREQFGAEFLLDEYESLYDMIKKGTMENPTDYVPKLFEMNDADFYIEKERVFSLEENISTELLCAMVDEVERQRYGE